MNILALDASLSSTGFSILNDNKEVLECGKVTTKPKQDDCERVMIICSKCEELIKSYNVETLVIEDQFVSRNKNTALRLARLFGAVMYMSKIHDLKFISIEPTKVRSILYYGDCSKEEMAEYILDIFKDSNIVKQIGPYSDKQNKDKTSDIYDAISIGMSYLVGVENGIFNI